ncbi:hypothetical protein D3870_19890 [Noviherbaspirillum cavernae]|uniref:Secreted protein n=1 Tax=Noviherbaspirillum cavernae TaxID=2320862 RepID=A0A418WVR1_9BURK|nr:hypothetical protein D3870_19890 [Noviherbaspirillum cavernae]
MILRVLRRLAVLLVLSAAAPLQGAHWPACQCRFAGGQQAARIPCYTLLRTASLHFVRRFNYRIVISSVFRNDPSRIIRFFPAWIGATLSRPMPVSPGEEKSSARPLELLPPRRQNKM